MSQNVKFFFTSTKAKYDALLEKNPLALYFITDEETGCNYFYKGDELLAVGHEASAQYAGLMSATDKAKLDALTVGGVNGLTPVDGTIAITDTEDGGKAIGVAISKDQDNALVVIEGGLFVPHAVMPRYTVEKQETAADGCFATYKLKQTIGEEVSYVGDLINIPEDKVLQSAVLKTVEEDGIPYEEAKVDDKYIEMTFNDAAQSHIYIPLGDIGNNVSTEIKIDSENANGLQFVDGTLSLGLATTETAGALSPVDKAVIDSIATTYATKEEMQLISDKVANAEASYTWGEL